MHDQIRNQNLMKKARKSMDHSFKGGRLLYLGFSIFTDF